MLLAIPIGEGAEAPSLALDATTIAKDAHDVIEDANKEEKKQYFTTEQEITLDSILINSSKYFLFTVV